MDRFHRSLLDDHSDSRHTGRAVHHVPGYPAQYLSDDLETAHRNAGAGRKRQCINTPFCWCKRMGYDPHLSNEAGIDRFLDSIDWGWFFFLTKPIFAVLHWLNVTLAGMGIAGSMGWAIIG